MKHVFVSYVREDAEAVEKLVSELRKRGVRIWIDVEQLRPGSRWRPDIGKAIRNGNAFLAIFSAASEARPRSYMRDELLSAVEELRLRPQDRAWFFPVLLDPCELPPLAIGPNETLNDLQWVKLYEKRSAAIGSLAAALNSTLLE